MSALLGIGARAQAQRGFNPASLFANSEPGLFATFSPSDVGTRFFTDTAGTTPAEIAQAVALTLEDSGNDNHPTQATLEYRPILTRWPKTGRVNYIDENSDALTTQTITVREIEYTLSFKGTGTVTLSGASTAGPLVGTGAEDIVSLTFTPTEGSLTLTVDGTVELAMLNTGATRGDYQKVVTKFDITEAGQRDCIGLWYDGVDDSLVTPTITPGVDKAQVFAGVRKLSDDTAIYLELSDSVGTQNGAFILQTPPPALRFGFRSRGTAVSSALVSGNEYLAPTTNVLTGLGDISGDLSTLRIDGAQAAQSTADQGTGNYLAYPLYIGARAGTSLFFKGIIWGLAVRFGPNLSEPEIQRVERYIARNTPEVSL